MKLFFIGLLLVCFSIGVQAQNLLSSKDLSTLKVDALTETDISQIQKDLKSKGITIDQFQDQAIAKGMPLVEFNKLKTRLNNSELIDKKTNPLLKLDKITNTKKPNILDTPINEELNNKKLNPLIYGSELFNQSNTGFAANQNLATPLNYIVGPKDVLKLVVYGVQEFSSDLIVSKEGIVQVANVGQGWLIAVATITILTAQILTVQ